MTEIYDEDATSGFDETAYYPENIAGPHDPGAHPLLPILPFFIQSSGLYRWEQRLLIPIDPIPVLPIRPIPIDINPIPPRPGPEPLPIGQTDQTEDAALIPLLGSSEELRLDVDGRYPQMMASGTLFSRFIMRTHWIARLNRIGTNLYAGPIWYKDGNTATFAFTNVTIQVVKSIFAHQRSAKVTYSGGGAATRTRSFGFASSYFHNVEFEYDNEMGAAPTLSINTAAHPNRPASLPAESLSIETVFRRTGFNATRSAASSTIPTDGPDPNTSWSDAEMHDAMQSYWSKFANRPQWAMWVLFARQHDMGSGLGGIMFDDIGPNHRQGTAIFTNSFINNVPAGDANPGAWRARMHFWTAVHEMGHGFNLAHSWQKQLGTPWIPLSAASEARSFMNYPYSVSGGQSAFFSSFAFRFSDQELLFMRHAPSRFVEMGNANWFDHHGFEAPGTDVESGFALELKVDRTKLIYEFMEPVVAELRFTNVSGEPKIVPDNLLQDMDNIAILTKKDDGIVKRWQAFAQYCQLPTAKVLLPGESLSESVFISVGTNGWNIDAPGHYSVQAAMQFDGQDLVSNPLRLRVAPSRGYDEDYVAQDVFTDSAARVMAFDGSQVLTDGIAAWEEVVARLPKSRVAVHAQVALALPKTRRYRTLDVGVMKADKDQQADKKIFRFARAETKEACDQLDKALIGSPVAAETLGRIDYQDYTKTFAQILKKEGDDKEVRRVIDKSSQMVDRLEESETHAKRLHKSAA
jgi:hypothetical protein